MRGGSIREYRGFILKCQINVKDSREFVLKYQTNIKDQRLTST